MFHALLQFRNIIFYTNHSSHTWVLIKAYENHSHFENPAFWSGEIFNSWFSIIVFLRSSSLKLGSFFYKIWRRTIIAVTESLVRSENLPASHNKKFLQNFIIRVPQEYSVKETIILSARLLFVTPGIQNLHSDNFLIRCLRESITNSSIVGKSSWKSTLYWPQTDSSSIPIREFFLRLFCINCS